MNMHPSRFDSRPVQQRGAALVIGLILLLVVTILAVSGVVTSTLELRMVGNQQEQEKSFQLADTAIERALATAPLSTAQPWDHCQEQGLASPCDPQPVAIDGQAQGSYEYELRFDGEASLPVDAAGYSLGSGFQAYHFLVESDAPSARGAIANHTQGFYIVGPGGGGLTITGE